MSEFPTIQARACCIAGCLVLKPAIWSDERGYFFEAWSDRWRAILGNGIEFAQDNQSRSRKHVLRGLHYQIGDAAQGKLVWVAKGKVFDVVVDLRQQSPTFGRWFGHYLDADSCERIWVPEGCAHGFLVVSDYADFQYKVTKPYSPEHERSLNWRDDSLAIAWPLAEGELPVVSAKDGIAPFFGDCAKFS
jgi:dTDP-4-dehydrorhamnose 3,5-epimerase